MARALSRLCTQSHRLKWMRLTQCVTVTPDQSLGWQCSTSCHLHCSSVTELWASDACVGRAGRDGNSHLAIKNSNLHFAPFSGMEKKFRVLEFSRMACSLKCTWLLSTKFISVQPEISLTGFTKTTLVLKCAVEMQAGQTEALTPLYKILLKLTQVHITLGPHGQ